MKEEFKINDNLLNINPKIKGKYIVELFDKDTGEKVDEAISYNSVYQPSMTTAYDQICFGSLIRPNYNSIYANYHSHTLFGNDNALQ